MAMPAMSPEPDNLPLSSFALRPGHHAIERHRTLLHHPSQATVELDTDHRRRSRAKISPGCRGRRTRARPGHAPRHYLEHALDPL